MKAGMVALIVSLGILSAALAAYPQQPIRVPRIATVIHGPAEASAQAIEAFRQGLRDLGYVEGQNIKIEFRFYPPEQPDLLPGIARDLVRSNMV